MMRENERGIALVVTLMAMLLLSALGAALVLATTADATIAANEGAATEAFYAAEAAFERTLSELQSAPDFTSILNGSTSSPFADGAGSGTRTLPDGTSFDLGELLNLANCQKRIGCTESDLNASIRDRPWGPRNPRWRLWSWGLLSSSVPALEGAPPVYVVSMVSDDPAETDANPRQDGAPAGATVNPGAGILLVRAEALGRRGAHRVIEGSVVRRDVAARAAWDVLDPATRGPAPSSFPLMQVSAWHEVR
jgi:hypothetical protein